MSVWTYGEEGDSIPEWAVVEAVFRGPGVERTVELRSLPADLIPEDGEETVQIQVRTR